MGGERGMEGRGGKSWGFYEQQGSMKGEGGGGEGGGGPDNLICARKLSILKGDKPDDWSNKTSLYIIWLVMFTFLEGLMLDAAWNPVLKCSK